MLKLPKKNIKNIPSDSIISMKMGAGNGFFSPRFLYFEEEISLLAGSIIKNGIQKPLTVLEADEFGEYMLVCGEKRLRAANLSGLPLIPCRIVNIQGEDKKIIYSLKDNIAENSLHFFELAYTLYHLIEHYQYTTSELSRVLGFSEMAITSKILLVELPDSVKTFLINYNLSEKHALILTEAYFNNNFSENELLTAAKYISENAVTSRQLKSYLDGIKLFPNLIMKNQVENSIEKPKNSTEYYISKIKSNIEELKNADIGCETYGGEFDGFYEFMIRIPCPTAKKQEKDTITANTEKPIKTDINPNFQDLTLPLSLPKENQKTTIAPLPKPIEEPTEDLGLRINSLKILGLLENTPDDNPNIKNPLVKEELSFSLRKNSDIVS